MELLLTLLITFIAAFFGFFAAMYFSAKTIKKEVEKDYNLKMATFGFLVKNNIELKQRVNEQLKNFNLRIEEVNKKLNE